VAIALMLVLIIVNSIMLDLAYKQIRKSSTPHFYREKPKEPTIFVDEESKRKMISKLLHDGWSNREISKELHISESEVESAVKQLSFSDFS
jgi:DNA-binding NarL/FixJ family response regulator